MKVTRQLKKEKLTALYKIRREKKKRSDRKLHRHTIENKSNEERGKKKSTKTTLG